MKKFKNSRLSTDSRKLQTLALKSNLKCLFDMFVFLNKPPTMAIQHSLFFTLLALPIKFWLDGKKNYSKNDRLE